MFCWCCSRHLRWSSAFFSAFFYVTMISFSSSVSFLPFFPWFIAYICIYPPKDELYIFLNVWSSSWEECVTQTWLCVSRWVGAVRDAPHVCSVDTATWSLPPFLCVVEWPMEEPWDQVTQLWPVNLPVDPFRVDPTVTPHAVTLDWGCHACADVSCQVWQGFSPACSPPCFLPYRSVQWQGSWKCLDRLRETYQLRLHCFWGFA